jgi:uncharacterized protein YcnI
VKRPTARAAIAVGAVILVVGGLASAAQAHVTIDTLGTAEQGGFAKFAFSVPNERDDASTVKLEVQLPQDHPLAFVSVQPKAGWEITTTTRDLDTPIEAEGASISTVVDTITWTATGDAGIAPGQFDEFWVSAGTMPTDVDQLEFPALQTYSSGEVVSWIDPTPASGEEPEHPIPTLGLAASGEDVTAGNATEESDDDDSNVIAIIALVVGALGLAAAVFAIVASRRRQNEQPSPTND